MKKYLQIGYTIFAVITLFLSNYFFNLQAKHAPIQENENYSVEFIKGTIASIQPKSEDGDTPIQAEINTETGKSIVSAPVSEMNNFNTYKKGNDILISKETNKQSGEIKYETTDFYHQNGLIWAFIIFTLLAIIVAKIKGISAIISVLLSLALFYLIFLKMVTAGFSPLWSCLLFTLIITVLTIPLIHGFNKKSLAAISAIFIGYTLSIFIVIIFNNLVQLGNTPGEEFRLLAAMYPKMSLSDILITSLFLGAIGALIDTAISIASAVFEALKEQTKLTFQKVYKIGMEVGKDVLGSMINTLLFAYLASSLPFLVLITLSQGNTLGELVNMDFIALELTRTFIGAISLIILIPITALISAFLLTRTTAKSN